MKTTFIFTVLAAGGLILSGAAFADDATNAPSAVVATNVPPHMPPHATFRGPGVDRLAQMLKLTDDQKAQFQAIFKAGHQKMMDLRENTSLSVADRRAAIKEIRQDENAKLQSVLTPEQFAKWQSMTHAHRPRMASPASSNSTNTPAQ